MNVFYDLVNRSPNIRLTPFLYSTFDGINTRVFRPMVLFLREAVVAFFFCPNEGISHGLVIRLILKMITMTYTLLYREINAVTIMLANSNGLYNGVCNSTRLILSFLVITRMFRVVRHLIFYRCARVNDSMVLTISNITTERLITYVR